MGFHKRLDDLPVARQLISAVLIVILLGCNEYQDPETSLEPAVPRDAASYPVYGGEGGRQYADTGLITPENVNQLEPVW